MRKTALLRGNIIAAAMVAAICTVGMSCMTTLAGAAPENVVAEHRVATGGIDATKSGHVSITIHKYQGSDTDKRSNGEVVEVAGRKPVKGVTFSLKRVKGANGETIDFTKSDDWKLIEVLSKDKAKKASEFLSGASPSFKLSEESSDVKTKTTDDKGEAKFENLSFGLYYIEEASASGATVDGKPIVVTRTTVPFFVTAPLPSSTQDSWLYDIHVYPKNDTSEEQPTKKAGELNRLILDDGETLLPWDISIPLVAPGNGESYKKIGFNDPLVKDLGYKEIKNVKLVFGDQSEDLQADTDYTITTTNGEHTVITLKLTDAGLKKADAKFKAYKDSSDAAKKLARLKATLVTTVKGDIANIVNSVNTWSDDNFKTGSGDDPNPKPCTGDDCKKKPNGSVHFGRLQITKVNGDKDTKKQPLKGAKFALYIVKQASTKLTDITHDNLSTLTDPVKDKQSDNDPKIIETGDNGMATIRLFAGKDDVNTQKYCLVETQAPIGYKKDAAPHCYEVKAEESNGTQASVLKDNMHEIVNLKAEGLDQILASLPMTGATGLVALTVLGVGGICGTFFYLIMRRRKQEQEENA